MPKLSKLTSLEDIRESCRGSIKRYAVAGAVNGINPLPGVDVGIDAAVCLKLMSEVRSRFGLNKEAEGTLRKYELLLPLVKKVFDYATKEGVIILLKSVGKRYLGAKASKYIPIVGQVVAAGAGYGMMRYFGNAYIEDCYQLAKKIRENDIVIAGDTYL
ncbi:MAG: DUF697 domain-containing protein [Selenomonadaceae bacterium]|nr:DUF697 domain-containing protein [Selenomonadaceae bacterium]